MRAPDGIGGELFFQKHCDAAEMPGIKQLIPRSIPGHPPLLTIESAEGAAVGAAQMNVVEFHTWNARRSRPSTSPTA